jgi:LysR family transcriptional regulator, hypochlorite-specific transcription factor HypT
MTLNLSWIDDFMALAESGNFSRAAAERHMTQPAFSRRIRALEEWLGVDLFDRSSQPARLTTAGEWFRRASQELQAHVARVPVEARAVAAASERTLRIAATHALSFSFLPGWLRGVEDAGHLGPIQLDSDGMQKCETLLLTGKVELALIHGHPQVKSSLDELGYEYAVVGRDRLVPVSVPGGDGQPKHRLEADGTVVGEGLTYGEDSGLGRLLRELKGRDYLKVVSQSVLTAQLASVLRTMALDGRGMAWLPEILVRDDMQAGRLVAAASEDWALALEVRLYRGRAPLGVSGQLLWTGAIGASSLRGPGSQSRWLNQG